MTNKDINNAIYENLDDNALIDIENKQLTYFDKALSTDDKIRLSELLEVGRELTKRENQ